MPHTATLPGLKRDDTLKSHFAIGQGYVLHLPRGPRGKGYLYCYSTFRHPKPSPKRPIVLDS